MIYTVTFNPAIDYVVRLDRELRVGDVNRASGEDCVLGGKGINVSGVLAQHFQLAEKMEHRALPDCRLIQQVYCKLKETAVQ